MSRIVLTVLASAFLTVPAVGDEAGVGGVHGQGVFHYTDNVFHEQTVSCMWDSFLIVGM